MEKKKINERQSVKISVYDNHVYDNTIWFSIQILHQDLLEWYDAANMDIHEHTLMEKQEQSYADTMYVSTGTFIVPCTDEIKAGCFGGWSVVGGTNKTTL